VGDKDGKVWRDLVQERRHLVFCFKENTVDCIAESYECVGTFPSAAEARRAVGELLVAAINGQQAP
jgi:hypothetical protein